MKFPLPLALILTIATAPSPLQAKPVPHRSVTLKSILKLESQVWEALKSGDQSSDARLLSDTFIGVYDTGISDKKGHVGQLANGPTVHSYKILEPRLIVLASDTAMLSYKAVWVRLKNGVQGESETIYISSIWRRSQGKWQNIFSQDTKASQ